MPHVWHISSHSASGLETTPEIPPQTNFNARNEYLIVGISVRWIVRLGTLSTANFLWLKTTGCPQIALGAPDTVLTPSSTPWEGWNVTDPSASVIIIDY